MQIRKFLEFANGFNLETPLFATTMDGGVMRRFPIVRVGRHNPPKKIDENVPLELFSKTWDQFDMQMAGEAIKLKQVIKDIGKAHQDSDLRVAVPTGQGHHRVLMIDSMGYHGSLPDDFPKGVDLFVEPWDSMHQVIRADNPEEQPA